MIAAQEDLACLKPILIIYCADLLVLHEFYHAAIILIKRNF